MNSTELELKRVDTGGVVSAEVEPPSTSPERLVKSTERVRDLGEVFTPLSTVREMLNLLPEETWAVHPSPTFLEPACGDGNFLIEILRRKLERVARGHISNQLPAGNSVEAAQFHALEALASIYAVDISVDNIVGGTPGHEVGARQRLLDEFVGWNTAKLGKRLSDRSPVQKAASWIVEHNLIIGNMLPLNADGRPTGRNTIPLIDYEFEAETLKVTLRKTTLGATIDAAHAETSTELSLFGAEQPELMWRGSALKIAEAEKVDAPRLKGPARNGVRRST